MARISRLIAGVALLLLLGMPSGLAIGAVREQANPACAESIVNGGFEYAGDWQLGASPSPPQYTNVNKHGGAYSLSLGISDGVNRQSFSSARQAVTIPAGTQSARLTFWFYAIATGAPTTDYMELAILSPEGVVLDKPWFSRNDSQAWNSLTFDLTAWQGRTIQLYFNVYNDGLGGMAQMFLDDVSLAVCTGGGGGGGLVTPAIPSGTPGGATVTPTRGACPKPSLNCGIPTPKASTTVTPATAAATSQAGVQPVPTYQTPAVIQPAPIYETPIIIPTSPEVAAPVIITAAVEAAGQPAATLPAMEMPAIITPEGAVAAPLVLATPGLWLDPVINGGFEQDFTGWSTAGDAPAPQIAMDVVHGGERAAQLGALEGVLEGQSSIYQEINVPADYTDVGIDFWVYPWSAENAGSDYQEVRLAAGDGTTLAELWRAQSDGRSWTRHFVPVTGFTGEPLRLQFTVYNDGAGGSTGMVVDDVSMVALTQDPDAQDGSRSAVAAPQPNVTRLALVVTVTPSAGTMIQAELAPVASRAPALLVSPAAPAAVATAVASETSSVFSRWPKYWWLIPTGAALIMLLLVWLARENQPKSWWLIGIGGVLLVLFLAWLANRP